MVVNHRKKHSRQRGSNTHGWGKNKHRNSGMRGGAGNAGSGKKSDSKKPSNWGTKMDYFGRSGFDSKQRILVNAINLRDVEDKLPSWVALKEVSQEAGAFVVDLPKLGYDKLLSSGKVVHKLKIIVPAAAEGAAEKVKSAGGELILKG
ncbi:MAG TPA: uL15 family ribosomal protein [Candidatus Nanoarchaeia archaeon]|nr:uL15 family ribosomal protein [Candidatus Nanoarchaeia archaeon]